MVFRTLPHRHRHSLAPPRLCLLHHLLRVAAVHGVVYWFRPRLAGERLNWFIEIFIGLLDYWKVGV